ncbi:hypothetical protein ACHAXS_000155, partial [Conticribra weissflogii]
GVQNRLHRITRIKKHIVIRHTTQHIKIICSCLLFTTFVFLVAEEKSTPQKKLNPRRFFSRDSDKIKNQGSVFTTFTINPNIVQVQCMAY